MDWITFVTENIYNVFHGFRFSTTIKNFMSCIAWIDNWSSHFLDRKMQVSVIVRIVSKSLVKCCLQIECVISISFELLVRTNITLPWSNSNYIQLRMIFAGCSRAHFKVIQQTFARSPLIQIKDHVSLNIFLVSRKAHLWATRK